MKKIKGLSDVWLKASVLGATWAASEIILGSFLHNLHIPFKGNILTSIGFVLLITASYKWTDKGLFWRSGAICALMKTMSPSAVIFGPMVAIFMEAVILEISVRIIGKNLFGFIVGAILAMSWILVQKVINLLLFYGFNIVEIYDSLLKFIQKQLAIHANIFWLPLFGLLALYAFFGIVTAFIGVKIGRELVHAEEAKINSSADRFSAFEVTKIKEFPYSTVWLVYSFAAIVGSLILIGNGPVYVWFPVAVLIVVMWVFRYKRGMRQLLRPKFWISFVVLTALSALLISSMNGSQNAWLDGLMTGLEMNTRAAIVIIGFTVLGTELYSPKIRNYFANSAYRQLSSALELAFETLPKVVAQLPDARTFITKPAGIIKMLVFHAEAKFRELKGADQPFVFIISGNIAEGKTSFIKSLTEKLIENELLVKGFYAPRIMKDGKTVGYQLVEIEFTEVFDFLYLKDNEDEDGIGKYAINKDTVQRVNQKFSIEKLKNTEVLVLDEIGRLEINGGGWSTILGNFLTLTDKCLVLSVRKKFVASVINEFNIQKYSILNVGNDELGNTYSEILYALNKEIKVEIEVG